jgi:predicted ATPase
VLVLGGPGIGKTTLVDAVATEAAAQEMTVLRTTGVPSESQVPFAGLHQLLLQVLHVADQLPGPQERAVLTAIGRLDAEVAEAVDVALASLSLLREAAAKGPLLVIAEDLHWLDRPSADALAFVGRRLEHDPIVLVATSREPPVGAIGEADLEVLELGPLEPGDAEASTPRCVPGS